MSYVYCFVFGGLFCVIAQILIDKTRLTPARILVLYVVLGVILGALGWYEPLVKLAGCGATTPLTGFGYLISEGVKDGVEQHGLLGAVAGGLKQTAAGISFALLCGFISSFLFRSKPRNQ